MKGFRILALGAFLLVVLGGCYMPVRFDAEIEITRGGYYDLIFDGYMVDVGLYKGLNEGKFSPDEKREKIESIKADFAWDKSTKEYAYIDQGHFKVNWRKSGDLIRARSVVFYRRQLLQEDGPGHHGGGLLGEIERQEAVRLGT